MEDKSKLKVFLPGLDGDIIDRRDALQNEIDSISRKATIEDFEVIRQILSMTKDPKTINRLAKGLALVAERLPQLNELNAKLNVLNFAVSNPEWFQMAFNNDRTIENALSQLSFDVIKDSKG